MKEFTRLSELGVNTNILDGYQVLCLPENIQEESENSDLVDSGESITLSKLFKEAGIRCANSYDLGLEAKVAERRSIDFWVGTIWILDNTTLPIVIGVISRLLGEKIQRRLDTSKKLEIPKESHELEATKVHANLKVLDGKISAEISYCGDADTFLKILHGIKSDNENIEK